MTYQSGSLAPNEVRRLFDRIAPVYDVMNRVMTAGLDRSWRRLAVEAVVQPGHRVLDACCGTGDLAIAAEREGGLVTGLDFSSKMLERARRKSDTIEWVEGDLLALPTSGAYNLAMSSNYNQALKPAVVLVKDGQARLMRRRQTFDDLLISEERL